ncbi:MAG: hypothetical protein JWM85_3200 [Acidimicrobiaceae bacterium]|nr:hypothetical protein [Acidimicrobiaceae bacterium]
MRRQASGPRRARSVNSYLRQTRIIAILALVAFAGAVVSDVTNDSFWGRHALLAGLVSSAIVVMLSVAVVNEVLERRRRQRWSVLAQYVMFELIRNARMIWLGMLEVTGLFTTTANQEESIDAGAQIVRDSRRLTAALRAIVDDRESRGRLQAEITFLTEHSDEVLGRWAAVMLNAEAYAEILDRHVELAGDIAWIAGLLDASNPPHDLRRQRRARSSPTNQLQAELSSEWLADRLVVITQLAEALDRGTFELALRIVPIQWWEARLGT